MSRILSPRFANFQILTFRHRVNFPSAPIVLVSSLVPVLFPSANLKCGLQIVVDFDARLLVEELQIKTKVLLIELESDPELK